MTRIVTVGAAQLGPIALSDTRAQVVARMIDLMQQAKSNGCDVVVFPELALTTFFPRWYFDKQDELDAFFERAMPGPETQRLFDTAKALQIGFYLGYAELVHEDGQLRRFNTAITVDKAGAIISKYRKIHLPGHKQGVFGMAVCNDRRWPETYRILGLQAVEMIFIGYNTPVHNPPAPEHDALSNFHNELVMQSGAYQNGTWVVGVAKAGTEEGVEQIGNSIIVAPSGEIVGACTTLGDELAIARCDLDLCNSYKNTTFNFARHREPEQYRMIVERKGAVPPEGSPGGGKQV